ncbi:MAG: PAS domain S-box protein [Alphaproteobacteria bacterium]|uniref:PAS domain S-box protein n=1 Tax=Candidatus Nitrobium versatile TaxID=2884831 RepID=A0A953LVG4_9BACT|nr:PAS domain S-box protein [Candidatus Nitrobium versatile]
MSDREKSREQLIEEVKELRRRISLLEGYKEAKERIENELRFYRETFLQQLEDHSSELILLNNHLIKTISEQKKAESRLRESESEYRNLVESCHELIWKCDREGRFIFLNPAWERTHGYTIGEMLGRHFPDFQKPAAAARDRREFRRHLSGGTVTEYETTHIAKDGSTIHLVFNAAPFYDAAGEIIGTQGTAYDITSRKHAEERLSESHKRLLTILDSLHSGVLVIDMGSYEVLYANSHFKRLYGDVIGNSCWKVIRKEQAGPCSFCNSDALLSAEGFPTGIHVWHSKDTLAGVWYLIHSQAIQWIDVRMVRLDIVTDITDIMRAKEDVNRMKASLEEAQRIARIGNWDWNVVADESWWSDEFYRLFGWRPQELTPTYGECMRRVHSGDRALVSRFFREAVRGRQPCPVDFRIIRSDRSERIIHSTAHVTYSEEGCPVRISGTVQDVTEQRIAESEVKASREQLRTFAAHLQTVLEKERAMIAREIHDELAQALTVIKIDLMDCAGKHTGEGAGHFSLKEKIQKVTSFIDEVIENVHRVAMALRPSILDDLGLESALEWQLQEFRKRTNCHCSFRSSMGRAVVSKEATTALFRICQEALINIARHARAGRVEVEICRDRKNIVLTVRDNGCGIEKRKITDSRSLGLLGMRERAAILGGEVSITGTRGKGTSVIASFPVEGE